VVPAREQLDQVIAKLEKEHRRLKRMLARHERDGYYDFADPQEVHAHGHEVGVLHGFEDALRLLRGMR
jgi:hypothetical protein